jgi:hypothetical protein
MSTKPEKRIEDTSDSQDDEIQHVALEGLEDIIPNQRLCEQCRTIRLSSDDLELALSAGFTYIGDDTQSSFRIGVHNRFCSVRCPFCWLLQDA